MPDPTVCAVMLTRDRPEYALRAVRCFSAQNYERKRLLIYDTGRPSMERLAFWKPFLQAGFIHALIANGHDMTVGGLRNQANRESCDTFKADIIIHADDDDYSHPNRIAEQVALLQSSGSDSVGYREMLFWREPIPGSLPHGQAEYGCGCESCIGGAYLYSNPDPSYCLGTSLCYWRKTWERNPFSERNGANPRIRAEDREFLRGIKSVGVSANITVIAYPGVIDIALNEPRMIARIHAGNAQHYTEAWSTSHSWRRAPEWDERCREIMA